MVQKLNETDINCMKLTFVICSTYVLARSYEMTIIREGWGGLS